MNINQIKSICLKYGIKPSREKGQNFLIDENIVKKIIDAADLKESDTVLEVGPGLGILTRELIKKVGRVVAVELDKKIIGFLQAEFLNQKKLIIVQGDILKVNLQVLGLKDFNYKVVANLPYSITSIFLRRFLEQAPRPSEMTLMVQKEVAERIVAQPGKMSLLSVAAQFYSQPKILFKVNRSYFWPEPEVDSAVVYLKLTQNLPFKDQKKFFQIAKIGFSSRRKQLQNNLAAGLGRKNEEIKIILRESGFNERVRAQDLDIKDWINLVKKLTV